MTPNVAIFKIHPGISEAVTESFSKTKNLRAVILETTAPVMHLQRVGLLIF